VSGGHQAARLARCPRGSAPEMSSQDLRQQRLQALGAANAMRSDRARLKRQIADGTITVALVLQPPPPESDGCSLGELLMSQRRWGRRRCMSFLTRHQLAERKLIRELTPRQREILAQELSALVGPKH
jgi:hypothetical protein